MKAIHPRFYLLAGLAVGVVGLGAGCSSATRAASQPPQPSQATDVPVYHDSAHDITPVRDQRAVDELKKMGAVLAAARTMTFEATDMTPLRGPNGQWVHLFKTARVEMRRPDGLLIQTGGDAFRQRIYFDGKTFATFAPETKLFAKKAMPGDIDAMLAQSADRGGDVFPFADVLLADPYAAWSNGLEGAAYVGESNRNGRRLAHLAFTAKDMDWEVWVGAGDHLPYMVYVKYKGEDRSPTMLVEFSKWHLDAKLPASDFSFVPPKGAKAADFKTPAFQTGKGEGR